MHALQCVIPKHTCVRVKVVGVIVSVRRGGGREKREGRSNEASGRSIDNKLISQSKRKEHFINCVEVKEE